MGAIKYADLSHNLATDYKFEWDKFLNPNGNTAVYLLYSQIRAKSVLRAYESANDTSFCYGGRPVSVSQPEETALARELLALGDALDLAGRIYRPHILCDYLYRLPRQNLARGKSWLPRGQPQDARFVATADVTSRHGSANDGNVTRSSAGDNTSCSRSTELEPKPQQRNDGATRSSM